jgi:hypothetical protein
LWKPYGFAEELGWRWFGAGRAGSGDFGGAASAGEYASLTLSKAYLPADGGKMCPDDRPSYHWRRLPRRLQTGVALIHSHMGTLGADRVAMRYTLDKAVAQTRAGADIAVIYSPMGEVWWVGSLGDFCAFPDAESARLAYLQLRDTGSLAKGASGDGSVVWERDRLEHRHRQSPQIH